MSVSLKKNKDKLATLGIGSKELSLKAERGLCHLR